MKKLLCFLFIVLSTALTAQSQTPSITMTTTTAVGSTFSINIGATASSTPIQVDWGNGILANYTIGTNTSTLSSTLGGSNVKVYGAGVSVLDVSSKNLTTLDVSGATALTFCKCDYNQLTTLDVSKNTALTSLDCSANQLNTLDVSKNTALLWLMCYSNQLTALDVSKNTALTYFNYYYNQLTTLDVSKNTALTWLTCSSNQLTTLDVSKNIALTTLCCGYNQLTALDVSKNTALTTLWCSSNQLTVLDVSDNTALTELWCYSNKLTTLDVSKNTALTELLCYSNQLTFTTLPIKQTTWVDYFYNPQAKIGLPKKNYTLSETIDLSSQLTANGNTTAYTWKTKGGATLESGVDFTANKGVFTFLKAQTDSVYCQMTNAAFPYLTLSTSSVKITQFPSSIEEINLSGKIYPNPVRDLLHIECEESISRVEVFTVYGAKAYEQAGNGTSTLILPTASLPTGLLIVKVFGRNGVMERKIVKE